MFSPIHRALGVEPGDLTIDLLEQAVQAGVRESENLDWKESLYDTQNPKWREEAAKDIAAMANSGGGWLVFGVRDEDDAAAGLSPVPWSGAEKQRLRQVAYAHIGPPVVGLSFTPVAAGDGTGSVVAVRIPDSAETPHLARRGQDGYVAPRRNGPHTIYMSEREIAEAYRVRFRARAEREAAIESLYRETADALSPEHGASLIVAALPRDPKSGTQPMAQPDAREIVHHATPSALLSGHGLIHGEDGAYRRGLRQWVLRSGSRRPWRKTIHEDGSVTVGYRLGGWDVGEEGRHFYPADEPNHCMSAHVEWAVAESLALVVAAAEVLDVQGGYTLRVGLVGREGEPIYIRTTEGGTNFLLGAEYVEPIHRFRPIKVDFDPLSQRADVLAVAREVCLDVINQGGVQYLKTLKSGLGDVSGSDGGVP